MRGGAVVRLLLLSLLAAVPAGAQGDLGLRASRRDTITAGATFTAAFLVRSGATDTVQVRSRVELPNDWAVLTGAHTLVLPPGGMEMLILSVSVPTRMAAGVYPVRIWITTSTAPEGVMDSVLVRVPERRALEVTLQDRPGFVVSGKNYNASFAIRNRGNQAGALRLSIRSTLGVATLSDTLLHLAAEESRVVRARVGSPPGVQAAADDVLEIAVSHLGDAEPTLASARITVVPEPSRTIEHFLKLPTRVNLRTATADGVSPFEIFGQGRVIDGRSAQLDFMLRGPTGEYSSFGEREEYRAELRGRAWRARAGDHVFMLSSLTSAGRPGFGIGADGGKGPLRVGAYGQEFRLAPEGGRENGAFMSLRPMEGTRLTANAVQRTGGLMPGVVGSGALSFDRQYLSGAAEMARSMNGADRGEASSARLSGGVGEYRFDLGLQRADTGFAGSQRGGVHNFFTTRAPEWGFVSLGFNGSMHTTDLSRATGVSYEERFNTGAIAATLFGRATVEYSAVSRGTTIDGLVREARQRGVRARADQDLPFGVLTLEVDAGRNRDGGEVLNFTDVTAGLRRNFRRGQVGGYVQQYTGGGITKGLEGNMTFGGDLSMMAGRATQVMLLAFATRQKQPGAEWHAQLDGLLTHTMANGSTISLRARLMQGGAASPSQTSVAYLEYGMPFRVPVSRLRTPGRVYGRVVDAVSGRGVPGALVRLGPQVAITDGDGEVAFGGVPGGEHRLSMSQETSFTNAVFLGNPTLLVDSTRAQPTVFSLAIARSARLDVDVRRYAMVKTAIANGAAADSLTEAGMVSNAMLILASESDTLYRTTDDKGKATFTDIPPGAWTLTIRGDTPAFTRFDPDRIETALQPGETQAVTFRLVPRKREVQLIGDGQELRPTAAEPKAQNAAGGSTKTVKPDERKQDHK